MRPDERDDAMAGAWASFVEAYRRRRAPAALRERIVAALAAAARAGRDEGPAPERAKRGREGGSDV